MAQVDTLISGVQVYDTLRNVVVVDVWKKTGQSFGTLGGGLVVALSDSVSGQLNLNLMALLPSSGFAIEPSIGAVMGF